MPTFLVADASGIIHESACWNISTAVLTFPLTPSAPVVPQQFVVASTNLATPAGTLFWGISGTSAAANLQNATESTIQTVLGKSTTFTGIFVRVSAAEGAAATLSFTLRRNGSTSTAVTCTIPNLGTTCNLTGQSVAFNAGDTADVQVVQVGTGTSQQVSFALVYQ